MSQIIATSIAKVEVQKHSTGYIVEYEEFTHEVLNIVNRINDRFESKLNVKLNEIEYSDVVELIDKDESRDDIDDDDCNRWKSLSNQLKQHIVLRVRYLVVFMKELEKVPYFTFKRIGITVIIYIEYKASYRYSRCREILALIEWIK